MAHTLTVLLIGGTRHETHLKLWYYLKFILRRTMHSYDNNVLIKCAVCLPFQYENTLFSPYIFKLGQFEPNWTVNGWYVCMKCSNWNSMNSEIINCWKFVHKWPVFFAAFFVRFKNILSWWHWILIILTDFDLPGLILL